MRQHGLHGLVIPTIDGWSFERLSEKVSVGGAVPFGRPAGRQEAGASDFLPLAIAAHRVPPPSPFACTVERRPALFKVKARLCDGEPPLARVRRTRLLESHFGKNLAEISIVTGLHCHIPIPKTHCAR